MTTLVTFLGLGKKDPATGTFHYEEVSYIAPNSDDRRVTTSYVARALSEFYGCKQVEVVATKMAWNTHEQRLKAALDELGLSPIPHIIPDGRNERELREQFRVVRDLLAAPADEMVLDITHGFRHQPFFAAAALAVLQAADDLPERMHIVYGAFEAGDPRQNTAPILNISHFIHMMHLAFGISIFLQTGHGEALVKALRVEETQLRQRRLQGKRQDFPGSNRLIGAVERFSRDLAAMRIPAHTGQKRGAFQRQPPAGGAKGLSRPLRP